MLIARVIADPEGLQTRIDALLAVLAETGMVPTASHALESNTAVWELRFAKGDAGKLRELIDQHLGPSDGMVTEREIALPKLFISDMDSTMIGQECIDELADFAGLKERISDITERAMQGELDFEAALRERVGLLAGLEEGAIQRCLDERIRPNPGARTLVQTLKAHGSDTVLVTGGFHHFADPVAEQIGFVDAVGNRLEVNDGVLTGGLAGPVVDSSVKKAVLNERMAGHEADAASVAAGDGANDIPMLESATLGVAYFAKPKARAAANCWIDRGDLTSVLALLGIPEGEWVRDRQ
ncbi:phosphoserine phosphatase SerB [Parerythrobacter jejuensis]|uniref:Phosphoserine phosphatase n=1 Tax=Parerythrobacter jejuensis TaxID=795812 RepID=A0A845ASX4_9SPHN|nr:phosphoserine phosphatase SerB [Parerythrobacter jejuensis]MXP32253.1 phosphoserine phosphatase SerB [Parerythrobacter jejuensis]